MSQSPSEEPPPRWLTARLASVVWRLTPHCREVVRLTSEGRDHSLPLGTRLRLGLHRRFCEWCARYAGQLDLIQEAVHRLDGQPGETLRSDVAERMKKEIRRRR
jgi:hypothetical protein